MTDDTARGVPPKGVDGSFATLRAMSSRREFFRVLGLGATIALLPAVGAACGSGTATGPSNAIPASGEPLLIDFEAGDVAILQLASVMEQIEADFYSRVVTAFGTSSNIPAGEHEMLTEIRDHELAHRAYLDGTLGSDASRTATATFRGVNFRDRTAVLTAAQALEDLGIAMYNGAAQYLTGTDPLLAIAKIVSVEGRHSAAIRDLKDRRASRSAPARATTSGVRRSRPHRSRRISSTSWDSPTFPPRSSKVRREAAEHRCPLQLRTPHPRHSRQLPWTTSSTRSPSCN